MGHGGGQVVIVLAFYSDDLSLNPAGLKFSVQKDENKQKSGRGWPIFKK